MIELSQLINHINVQDMHIICYAISTTSSSLYDSELGSHNSTSFAATYLAILFAEGITKHSYIACR